MKITAQTNIKQITTAINNILDLDLHEGSALEVAFLDFLHDTSLVGLATPYRQQLEPGGLTAIYRNINRTLMNNLTSDATGLQIPEHNNFIVHLDKQKEHKLRLDRQLLSRYFKELNDKSIREELFGFWVQQVGLNIITVLNAEYIKAVVNAAIKNNNVVFLNLSDIKSIEEQNKFWNTLKDMSASAANRWTEQQLGTSLDRWYGMLSYTAYNRATSSLNIIGSNLSFQTVETNSPSARKMYKLIEITGLRLGVTGLLNRLIPAGDYRNGLDKNDTWDFQDIHGIYYMDQSVAQPMRFEYSAMKEDPVSSRFNFVNELSFGTAPLRDDLAFVIKDSSQFSQVLNTINNTIENSTAYPPTKQMKNIIVQSFTGDLDTIITGTKWFQVVAIDMTVPASPINKFAYYITPTGSDPAEKIVGLTTYFTSKVAIATDKQKVYLDNLVASTNTQKSTYSFKLQICDTTQASAITLYQWDSFIIPA